MTSTPITVAYGDGTGPEIMEAVLHVLKEAGAGLEIETVEVGERVYNMGATSGILPSTWNALRRTRILLKNPTVTPMEPFVDVTQAILTRMELDHSHRLECTDARMEGAAAFATIGEHFALFSLSDPVNFRDLLLAATALLVHIGQTDIADIVKNAWVRATPGLDLENTTPQELAKAIIAEIR